MKRLFNNAQIGDANDDHYRLNACGNLLGRPLCAADLRVGNLAELRDGSPRDAEILITDGGDLEREAEDGREREMVVEARESPNSQTRMYRVQCERMSRAITA